jgi:hypothetical protein
MKAEHRRELHTNLLADRMGRLVQGMRGTNRSTSVYVWVFLGVAVVTYAVWQYAMVAGSSGRSAEWTSLDAAMQGGEDGSQLGKLANENAGTIPGRTARFVLARLKFKDGQDKLSSIDRTRAIESLVEARKEYEKLAGESADAPLLEQEALLAVAKAEEMLASSPDPDNPGKMLGSLDRALEFYRRLATRFPGSPAGKDAAERAELLSTKQAEVARFYQELEELAGPKSKSEEKPK